MFAKERQERIARMIEKNGAVTTGKLVEEFGVSVETIRRDLLEMERAHLLHRVHGGAIAMGAMKKMDTLSKRNQEFGEEKRQLAQKAMDFVCEGDIISVDVGSTAIAFAEALKARFSRLTVITHSLDVFELLHEHQEMSVILCGGHYMKGENAFYGALTLEMMSKLHVQKAFIFPSAVSMKYGIADYSQEFYLLQKKMMESAERIYVLADSSKFEKRALLKVEDMKPDFCYVTDSMLSDELKQLYQENNLQVIC